MEDKAEVLRHVASALSAGSTHEARATVQREYPFIPVVSAGRNYNEHDKTTLFIRDGFIDRYFGDRLVYPGALLLLSHLLPEELPRHPNWKVSACHTMYWELYPALDHIIPLARGGKDEMSNWATTSGFRNAAKGNALLEEIGWILRPEGNFSEWDGLIHWFVSLIEQDRTLLQHKPLKPWYTAASRALKSL